jgi:hypothetical protein
MAIIDSGEVLLEGSPTESLAGLAGRIWSRVLSSDEEMKTMSAQHQVVSSHLVGGQHAIRVYATDPPGDGFTRVEPQLDDVYFLTVSRRLVH